MLLFQVALLDLGQQLGEVILELDIEFTLRGIPAVPLLVGTEFIQILALRALPDCNKILSWFFLLSLASHGAVARFARLLFELGHSRDRVLRWGHHVPGLGVSSDGL